MGGKKFDKEKAKARVREAKSKASYGFSSAMSWCKQNPGLAIGLGLIGSKLLWEFGRAQKRRQVDRLEEVKMTTVYDPELGQRWHLKRLMDNREMLEYRARVDSGQSRGEALEAMGLLK